ncbi:hypothetical protein AAH979_37395 [Plantactinospora sp. ZYX-F-223]|uniref:hypothetical protein n=1 Tax=Plantactinospora sp. ZYX-F-223 TaxID=3144103 RepID=UPI0031FD77D0
MNIVDETGEQPGRRRLSADTQIDAWLLNCSVVESAPLTAPWTYSCAVLVPPGVVAGVTTPARCCQSEVADPVVEVLGWKPTVPSALRTAMVSRQESAALS